MRNTLLLSLLFLGWNCQKECCEDLIQSDRAWIVDYIETDDGRTDAPHDVTFRFESDSTFSLKLDLNSCGGSYTINESQQTWEAKNVFCTLACCDSDFSEQAAFLIGHADQIEVNGKRFILSRGEERVVFGRE
ncbi:MAG: hypothetical protein AAGI23_06230 [Bacteroidota bacterium]